MIIDLRSIPAGEELACDVCIIGGGVAGIALALEMIGAGVNVILLESGGFDYEEETQDLYRGKDVGIPYFELDLARLRFFGGTSNHWGGWSRPLEPIDFESRDWVTDSGWPISFSEFSAHLGRASEILEIPSYDYDAHQALKSEAPLVGRDYDRDKKELAEFEEAFDLGLFRFSPPTLMGERYRADLESADNIKVLLHANVTDIGTVRSPDTVDSVAVTTLGGHNCTIKPKKVVLAAGGVENARLLLTSNKTHHQGLGNTHDLVGRYFADHVEAHTGYILTSDHSHFFNLTAEHRHETRYSLDLSPSVQRDKKLLNFGFSFHKAPNMSVSAEGVSAAKRLKDNLSKGEWPDHFFSDLGKALMDIDDVISFLGSKSDTDQKGLYVIMNKLEPEPNRDSRVLLGRDKDRLGMPRVELDWQLTELDYRTIIESQKLLGKLVGKAGFGRLKMEWDQDFDGWPANTTGGYHHMGTTRMAATEKQGVVDSNAKVFGISNLFVAGSSVFPTFGKVNPTMNLVALTVRLAHYLKAQLGGKK
ncbi:GMC family oxidoreductase [Kordiimonas sediminis]|uniref:GMC family oxidoreductase n=1 Tax=Kordiimonas sediminis TaxID=1735581 RepID=A0A919AWA5_9PROT|nr:GMC family oxidoreductase [Kordiimonas sediminis]GHF29411.1 GMC family oxidoreductase [Kordiimonas sediminis]